jgi:hypothetical protein
MIRFGSMRWAGLLAGESLYTGFWWGDLRERRHLDDLGLEGRLILRWVFRKWDGGMDWINLAQGRDRCRAFADVIVNLRVP